MGHVATKRDESPRSRRAAAVLLTALCAACVPARPNVLLVSIDTLRADHCSSYGYERPTTPTLDALARQGARFRLAYAPMPTTAPSHATLLTGLYPVSHGVTRNGAVLGEAFTTLPEVLAASGYDTASVVSSFVLDPRFGMDQGFGVYDARFPREHASIRRESFETHDVKGGFDRRAEATTDRALTWLRDERDTDRPFLLFVHYFDPHHPYDAPGRHRNRFVEDGRSKRVALYDAEIAYTDQSIYRLLGYLRESGLADTTLVVVTADHGEGLGQHGSEAHDIVIYEEAVRIPLVFRWPARIPPDQVLLAPVELVDLFPTILDLLGLRSDVPTAGRSLADALVGDAKLDVDRPVFVHRRLLSGRTVGERRVEGEEFGVRVGSWKLIENTHTGAVELFDLSRDPGELRNVARMGPERTEALSARIDAFLSEHAAADDAGAAHRLAPDVRETLRSLGYVD